MANRTRNVKYYIAKRTAAAIHRVKENHPDYTTRQISEVLGICKASVSVALNHYYPTGMPHEDYYITPPESVCDSEQDGSAERADGVSADVLRSIDDKLGRILGLFEELMAPTEKR